MPLSNKLAAGELRHRINIVQPSGTQDSTGGVTGSPSSWTTVYNVWAKIVTLSGKDQMAAGTFVSAVTHQITIRIPRGGASEITNGMVVQFKKRTFQIQAVMNPDETNKMLYLMCTEVNGSAGQQASPSNDLG